MIRSLLGRGQYCLLPEFGHLTTTVHEWSKMRPEQRSKMVSDFDTASVSKSIKEKGRSSDGTQAAQSTLAHTVLSIEADDSGIHTIPIVTLQGMWNKANRLLAMENGVTSAPGVDKKARIIADF